MSDGKQSYAFGAETGKILQLMIHSLYSNKDIFLRELISNASDACDKLRYEAQQQAGLDASNPHILIVTDEETGTLTIEDNGIGMDKADLTENLGTIASSGTDRFAKALQEAEQEAKDGAPDMNLIGRFGVGFYSAFMVASHVTVHTKKAGGSEGWRWESDGQDSYAIEQDDENAPARGTRITLKMREDAADYLSEHRIRHIIRTYSDHIPYPIKLQTLKKDAEENAETETVNDGNALWAMPKDKVTEEQYRSFYKHIAHAGDDPWLTMHGHAEGTISYRYLLFLPTEKPFDLYNPDRMTRVRLYVKRVFITEENSDLIPRHLRFLRGVIDSEDLPLNISRESLQANAVIRKIKRTVTNKVLSELEKKKNNAFEEYSNFWDNFGPVLKEGLCEAMDVDKEKLLSLCLFRSSDPAIGLTTVDDYLERAKEKHHKILYLIGENENILLNSAQLEGFRKQGLEVLLFTDSVDDFWVNTMHEYKDAELVNITRSGLDPEDFIDGGAEKNEEESEDTRKEKEAKKEEESKTHEALCAYFKTVLGGKALDVRVSRKLHESPVCLAIQEGAMDMRLERFLISQNQLPGAVPKVLEINPDHPIVKNIDTSEKSADTENAVHLLFEQACIAEGAVPEDPHAYTKRVYQLMKKAGAA